MCLMCYPVKQKTYCAAIKHVKATAGFTKPFLQIMCCNCPYACFMVSCCYLLFIYYFMYFEIFYIHYFMDFL